MLELTKREKFILAEFSGLSTWEDRYKKIIFLGKKLEGLAEDHKTDENKVKGCQSQVWIKAELNDENKIIFSADSDAMIVRGLVSLLVYFFSHLTPQEILKAEPTFISKLDLNNHLSPSRANGLASLLKQIKFYALAYNTKLNL